MAYNFANGISNDPARYGLSPAEGASIMQAFNVFNAAFMVAVNPKTRTRSAICDKDDARSILRNCIRNYAAHIRANLGIIDGDKIGIGVRPRNIAHNRRRCPHNSPLLQIVGSPIGFNQLFYTDSNTPGSRAKPYGAEALELWVAFSLPGESWPKVSKARYIGKFKKNPIRVPLDLEQEALGGRPTYWARWVGFDNEVGPWSLPMSLAIARAEAAKKSEADAAKKPQADDDKGERALKLAA